MCVTTDGSNNICGKFKSAKEEQERGRGQEQEESRTPVQSSGYRKEAGGVTYLLRNCKMSERRDYSGSFVKCNLVLTVKRDNQVGYIYAGSGASSITDTSGNTYPSDFIGHNGRNYREYDTKMSIGIDYVVDLYFPMKQEISSLSLLNVIIANRKVLQFRNIPVSN